MFSISCMSRATKNSVMKRHVLSPKYLQHLDFAIFMLKSNIAKVFMTTFLLYSVRMLYFWEAVNQFKSNQSSAYALEFNDPTFSNDFHSQLRHILYGNWYVLKFKYLYWEQTLELEHKFNFCFLLVVFSYICIGLESPKSTLFYKFTSNKIFKIVLGLQILFIIAYYALSTTAF